MELVQIRTQIANLYGYDSYAEYADTEIYYRDYDREDLRAFYEGVRPVAYRYQEPESESGILPEPDGGVSRLVEMGQTLVQALPPEEQACKVGCRSSPPFSIFRTGAHTGVGIRLLSEQHRRLYTVHCPLR